MNITICDVSRKRKKERKWEADNTVMTLGKNMASQKSKVTACFYFSRLLVM